MWPRGSLSGPPFHEGGLNGATLPWICSPHSTGDQTQGGKYEQENWTDHLLEWCLYYLCSRELFHSWALKWICSGVRGAVEQMWIPWVSSSTISSIRVPAECHSTSVLRETHLSQGILDTIVGHFMDTCLCLQRTVIYSTHDLQCHAHECLGLHSQQVFNGFLLNQIKLHLFKWNAMKANTLKWYPVLSESWLNSVFQGTLQVTKMAAILHTKGVSLSVFKGSTI